MINDLKELRDATAIMAEQIIREKEGLNRYSIERRDSYNIACAFDTFGINVFLWPNINPQDSTFIFIDLQGWRNMDENMREAQDFLDKIKAYVPRAASATVPA